MKKLAWIGMACLIAQGLNAPVYAQEFPARTVRIVVPYPPGGGVDGLARPLAERLSRLWNQPVLVENRAGAATMIGGDAVAKAAPDGHTLLLTSDSSITSNPHLYPKMPFDPMRDLAPVTQLIDLHQMVVAHPSVTANTLQELVALARAKPGALNYGSYGGGSQPHLLFEALKAQTGVQLAHIPYKGIAPALTAAIAGDPRPWFGVFAPTATPRAVVDKIRRDIAAVLAEPEFREREITGKGYTGVGSTPDEFAAFVRGDLEAKGKLIRVSGAKAE